MIMDGKARGTLVKNKDGREIPADEFIVFRPADDENFLRFAEPILQPEE